MRFLNKKPMLQLPFAQGINMAHNRLQHLFTTSA